MKSLPEKEFWRAIASRLERYREEPADDWDRTLFTSMTATRAGAVCASATGASAATATATRNFFIWISFGVVPTKRDSC